MSSITTLASSFLEPQTLARFTEQWGVLKSNLITNIGKACLESQTPSVQGDLDEMKKNYTELLSIFQKMQQAHELLNEVKEKGCSSFVGKLLGMSFADTASLCAGLGMALFTFYSEQEQKDGVSKQESSALKITSIALIGLSQVIGKYKDYTSSLNSKKQMQIQRSLSQITDVIAQKDLLTKTKTLIKTGERLLQTSRGINNEESQKAVVSDWDDIKRNVMQVLMNETLELEDREDEAAQVQLALRFSSLSLGQEEEDHSIV
jgi:hypothetical protein